MRALKASSRKLSTSAQAQVRSAAPSTLANPSSTPQLPSIVTSVINSLKSMPPRASVAKAMESLKGKVSMQDFALVFKELSRRGEWHLAWRLFKYMQKKSWCPPNEHIYTIMIGIMGRENMLDKCLQLFEGMPENGVEWNVYSFTALINAYGRNGRYEVSLDLLTRMRREGILPNVITYNSVLNACAKGALPWDQLLRVFGMMREDGVQPDRITFSTLLAACSTRGLVVEAGSVFRTMVRSGVAPDQLAYATVLDVFRRGGRLGIVRMLLQEMQQNKTGPQPDATAYTMLIDAFGMDGDYASALEVFSDMSSLGVLPDISTFTALLKALGRSGRYEEARQMVLTMKAYGATPDLATYHALVQVFTAGGYFQEAASVFLDMVDGQQVLTEESYTLLLEACGAGGLSDQASSICRHMKEQGLVPSCRAYQALITAHGNAARYPDALSALHDAINDGAASERGPYHALMEAYARAGLHNDTAFIYALMLQEGGDGRSASSDEVAMTSASPSLWDSGASNGAPSRMLYATNETFNLLIEAFCKGGLYDEALAIRDDMLEARRSPDEFTYAAMVSVYCGVGHYEAALAQVLEIKEGGILPPLQSYCDLLTLCARRGRWRTVRMILEEMGEVTRVPEFRFVRDIVIGNYQKENWAAVEDFLGRMKREGSAANLRFYCSVLDALWSLGLRSLAKRIMQYALQSRVFPEVVHQTQTLWAANLHRLSRGAALAALYLELSELTLAASKDASNLPPLYTIILRHGTDSEQEESDTFPLKRAVQDALASLKAPLTPPEWQPKGRFFCNRQQMLPWLLEPETRQSLQLEDKELPVEALARRRG